MVFVFNISSFSSSTGEPKCKCASCGRVAVLRGSVPAFPPLCRPCASARSPASGQRPPASRVNFHCVEDLASSSSSSASASASSSALLHSPLSHSSTQSSPNTGHTASDQAPAQVYKVPLHPVVPFSYGTSPPQPPPLPSQATAAPHVSMAGLSLAEAGPYRLLNPGFALGAYGFVLGPTASPSAPPGTRPLGTPGRSAFYALPNNHPSHPWSGPL